ncbi:MAG: hypothetical protein PHD25_11610 [Bacteroidales bacterium]|nr:hypothetical protein [Bacteroidales bacterium]
MKIKVNSSLIFSLLFTISLNSHSGILVLNGLTHQNTVSPGESYQRILEIQNGSDQTEDVMIYHRDYRYNYMGETFYDEPGSHSRSNAGWIKLSQTYLTLQPNEKVSVVFQVQAPLNDSLQGTYWSVIMVEAVEPPDPETPKGTFQIKSIVRYGIQVITHIGITGKRELNFLGTSLIHEDTLTTFNVYVENPGERMMQHTVQLELFDDEGNSSGIYSAPVSRTYPGTSVCCPVDLTGAKPGKYSALLIADCDEGEVFGTNITLEIVGSKSESIPVRP